MVTRIKNVGVDRLNRISGKRVSKANGKSVPQAAAPAAGKAKRRDDVEVSRLSRTIGLAGEAANAAPDVRSELIAPIREALANGEYKISSLDVADKILRQVLMERKKAV